MATLNSAPSLSTFVAELHQRNIGRQNQFFVEIVTPPGLKESTGLVSMWCSSAATPNNNILTDDTYLEANTRRKFAYDQDYQNLVLTFYVDQGYSNKLFFDKWKSLIVPQRRNFNYPKEYTAESLNLYLLDQGGNSKYKYEYSRVYPKTVNNIDYSHASVGLATLTIEFVYEDVFYSNEEFSSKPKSVFNENNYIYKQSPAVNPVPWNTMPINTPTKIVSGQGGDFGGGGATGTFN